MAVINPTQLDIVAAFLECSREHLGIEHTIRLHWPLATTKVGCGDLAGRSRSTTTPRRNERSPVRLFAPVERG